MKYLNCTDSTILAIIADFENYTILADAKIEAATAGMYSKRENTKKTYFPFRPVRHPRGVTVS